MNLRDERIQELTDLIAARMPPRKIDVAPAPAPFPSHLLRRFDWWEANAGLPTVEPTERARSLLRIAMIAARPGWAVAVAKALHGYGVANADQLSDDCVQDLLERMEDLELRAQTCCDDDDALPAR